MREGDERKAGRAGGLGRRERGDADPISGCILADFGAVVNPPDDRLRQVDYEAWTRARRAFLLAQAAQWEGRYARVA